MSTRDTIVAELVALRRCGQRIPGWKLANAAELAGCSSGHLRRLVAEQQPATVRDRFDIPDWMLPALYVHPTIRALHDDLIVLRDHLQRQRRPLPPGLEEVPSYSTLCQAVRRLPAHVRHFASGGSDAVRLHQFHESWTAPHRNAIWQADSCQLRIWILPEGRTNPIRPWIVSIIDDRHRVIVAAGLTLAAPTSDDAAFVFVQGTQLRSWPGDQPGLFGGVPDRIIIDNGSEFKGRFVDVAIAAGTALTHAPPHTPTAKGKIERWFGAFDRWAVSSLPGAVHGPRDFASRSLFATNIDELLDEHQLWTHLTNRIDEYNTRRRHRSVGCTPARSWNNDPTPLVEPDAALTRSGLLLDHRPRRAARTGITHRARLYVPVDSEYDDWIGELVHVRYHRHRYDKIELYGPDGAWICTAHERSELPDDPARRGQRAQRRATTIDQLERDARHAAQVRIDQINEPPAPGDTPSILIQLHATTTEQPAPESPQTQPDFIVASESRNHDA